MVLYFLIFRSISVLNERSKHVDKEHETSVALQQLHLDQDQIQANYKEALEKLDESAESSDDDFDVVYDYSVSDYSDDEL